MCLDLGIISSLILSLLFRGKQGRVYIESFLELNWINASTRVIITYQPCQRVQLYWGASYQAHHALIRKLSSDSHTSKLNLSNGPWKNKETCWSIDFSFIRANVILSPEAILSKVTSKGQQDAAGQAEQCELSRSSDAETNLAGVKSQWRKQLSPARWEQVAIKSEFTRLGKLISRQFAPRSR